MDQPSTPELDPDRRRLLALSGLGIAALAGCTGSDDDDEQEPEPEPEPEATDDGGDDTPEETDDSDEEPDEEPRSDADDLQSALELLDIAEPLYDSGTETFDGSGAEVVDGLSLGGALTIFTFEHDGDSNFVLELEGPTDELLVNRIGPAEGAVAAPVENGDYIIDVEADGDWSLTVGQPLAPGEEIRLPSVSVSGDGPDVVGPIELEETTTFAGEHEADGGNFIVRAINEDATSTFDSELVFNEIGEYEGETRVDPVGLAWIDVEADGPWRLEIE